MGNMWHADLSSKSQVTPTQFQPYLEYRVNSSENVTFVTYVGQTQGFYTFRRSTHWLNDRLNIVFIVQLYCFNVSTVVFIVQLYCFNVSTVCVNKCDLYDRHSRGYRYTSVWCFGQTVFSKHLVLCKYFIICIIFWFWHRIWRNLAAINGFWKAHVHTIIRKFKILQHIFCELYLRGPRGVC